MYGISNLESYKQSHMAPRIIREEQLGSGYNPTHYWIEENSNYPEGEGNLFLHVGRNRLTSRVMTPFAEWVSVTPQMMWDYDCIGGVDRRHLPLGWEASINTFYDEATDSDCKVVYTGDSRKEAIEALWNRRNEARREGVVE